VWIDIYSGNYTDIVVTFFDQNFNQLSFNDYEITLSLAFGIKDEKTGVIN
jgi:hypothetical protein